MGIKAGVVLRRLSGRSLVLAMLVATSCTVPDRPAVVPGPENPQGAAPRDGIQASDDVGILDEEGGVSLVPLTSRPLFVFGPPVPVSYVQEASDLLVSTVPQHGRLTVQPLPSPRGTAAVNLIEEARKKDRWGELLTPAQRLVFAQFGGDPSLGDWLVVVNDVKVLAGPDPIPLTAYRWPRQAVEEYVSCGIPEPGHGIPWEQIDQCSSQFYLLAEMKLVAQIRLGQQGTEGGGQSGR
jgi:hypothetical protein